MSNMTHLWLSGVFFQALNTPKTRFRPGLRPGPRWGSLRRSPRPPSRLDSLSPRRLDLGASVASPPTQIPGYAYDTLYANCTCIRGLFAII